MSEIPKVIHYCWFGGNPLPEKYKSYMASWGKFFPEYEIKEWNESNFDFSKSIYAKEAYEEKKWAFVSDYARFKILYENGGIYFDTDVEVIKSMNNIIDNGPFMGIEVVDNLVKVNPGLGLGVTAGHEIYKEILNVYENIHFRNEDGSLNLKTVVEYTSDILENRGFVSINKKQCVKGINIYKSDVFSPMDCVTGKINITKDTVSIHHYSYSWGDKKLKRKKMIQSILGPKITGFIINIKRKLK